MCIKTECIKIGNDWMWKYLLQQSIYLAVIFVSIKISSFSCRSDDLSKDFASSFTGISSCEAIYRCIDLSVEFAHVIFVEHGDISCFVSKTIFFVTQVASVSSVQLSKSSFHAVLVSVPEAFFRKRVENSLKIFNK